MSKQRVEISSERTETTTTFANPDGTLTTEAAPAPIRIRHGSGWQAVDTTLVTDDRGVHPKAALGDAVFSAGGNGEAALLHHGNAVVGLRWPGKLPTPIVKGNTATYPDVRPGVDLVLTALRQGFEQSLVIKQRPNGKVTFKFPLRHDHSNAGQSGKKTAQFTDERGEVIAESAPAVMHGADTDPTTGDPKRTEDVPTTVTDSGSGPVLEVAPDQAFLDDPTVQYPVTIDPAIHLTLLNDTWVAAGATASQWTAGDLRSGKYTGTGAVQRSMLKFDTSAFASRHITDATLALYNYFSQTCAAKETRIYALAGAFGSSTVWTNQPSSIPTIYGSSTSSYGGTGCGGNWLRFNVTTLAENWGSGKLANNGLLVRAADEADTLAWKRFYSADYVAPAPNAPTAYLPSLSVTYNTYPLISRIEGPGDNTYVGTTTPQLRPVYRDPDASTGYATFEVATNDPGMPVSTIAQGQSAQTMSGATAAWTVPGGILADGHSYQWRALAHDSTDAGQSWTSWQHFTVDQTAPAKPTVSSADHPTVTAPDGTAVAGWTPNKSGTFTFADPSPNTAAYLYSLDRDSVDAAVSTIDNTATFDTLPTGLHHLYVWARNHAGLISSTRADYPFGVSPGAMSRPAAGDHTQRRITLAATAQPGPSTASVRYDYRRADTDSWTPVSLAHVTGTSAGSWPIPTDQNTERNAAPELVWDVPADVDTDGPVQVRACFSDSTGASETCTDPVTFELDQNAFGESYATRDLGPGTLSLLTGNYSITATDATIASYAGPISLTRTFNSRQPNDPAATMFGAGWTSSAPIEDAAAGYRALHDAGSYVTITDTDGSLISFLKQADGSYQATADDNDLSLTKPNGRFTVNDLDGNETTFAPVGAADQQPETVTQASAAATKTTASYTYSNGKLTQVSAAPPGVGPCTPTSWPAGCRGLVLTYNTGGQVDHITLKTSGNDGTVTSQDIAAYQYSGNQLIKAWDPRLPALVTTYGYDSAGRLQTITPPGQNAWTFEYASDNPGRLQALSRTQPNGTNAKTTIVYDVPLTGGMGRQPMTAADVARWGQTDVPTDATAIFPASHPPASTTATSTGFDYATISYLDVNGREVNTASPGGSGAGRITTSEYDRFGNVIRQLTAANRTRALAATDPVQTAFALDTRNLYSPDGLELRDTYEPMHEVTLPGGGRAQARQHTHTDYDQNKPDSTAYHLPTTVTESASLGPDVPATTAEQDSRVTQMKYAMTRGDGSTDTSGWQLRKPLQTITDPGSEPEHLNIIRTTLYDPATGLPTETRQPNDPNGVTAATTKTSYYTADASSADVGCRSKPAWAGMPCKTGPAAPPSSGPPLPTSTTTYTSLLAPDTVSETSGAETRTTTTQYDAAGRPTGTTVTSSQGVAIPQTTTSYDPGTGLPTSTSSGGRSITRGYDTLGRITSYTDADGNTSYISYDLDGRRSSLNDGKGAISYTYSDADGTNDQRGLLSQVTFGAIGSAPGGTFTANYDDDGQLASQTYPGGLVAAWSRDAAGNATALEYSKNGAQWIRFEASDTVHDQRESQRTDTSAQTYGYDAAGRLTSVVDNYTPAGCTRRTYGYDKDSNRTSLETLAPNGDLSCATGSGSPSGYGYDSADRGTDGYSYDAFGRTTTIPANRSQNGATTTVDYYSNDLAHTITSNGASRTYSLDPNMRLTSWTGTTSAVQHYTDDADSPAWTDEGAGAFTRYLSDVTEGLGATQDNAGNTTLQLTNLHGDIAATASSTSTDGVSGRYQADEFGNPQLGGTPRYGWIGQHQRETDNPAGLVTMGVRLYNPITGRFLQLDPIMGGSDSAYDYAGQDPVNAFDLDGTIKWPRFSWRKTPTSWGFFDKRNRHLVMRDGKPGIHWYNPGEAEPNRIEFGKGRGYHFNPSGQRGVHLSVRSGVKSLAKSGLRAAARNGWKGLRAGARSFRGGGGGGTIVPIYFPPLDPSKHWHW